MLYRVLILLILFPAFPAAEEGMWTFDNLPTEKLKESYGFSPSTQWLDHLRLSSVRIKTRDGLGSGAFVSPEGLVLTNHHVISGSCIPEKRYASFSALTRGQETGCPGVEVEVPVSMENVTQRVSGAVQPGGSAGENLSRKKAEIIRIEKESSEYTGLYSEVAGPHHGGEYRLYRYRKYDDVRLVMTPHGGAGNNDFAFLRVYAGGLPVHSEHYLKWKEDRIREKELALVSGYPGVTRRRDTLAQLKFAQVHGLPSLIDGLTKQEESLVEYSRSSPKGEPEAMAKLEEIELRLMKNKLFQHALKPPLIPFPWTSSVSWKKRVEESLLRRKIAKNKPLSESTKEAWENMEKAQLKRAAMNSQITFRDFYGSELADLALNIVRYTKASSGTEGASLDDMKSSVRDFLRRSVFSPVPVDLALEEKMLETSLALSLEKLGPDDPFVREALAGRTPAEAARGLLGSTRLNDMKFREELVAGGEEALRNSNDPLVRMALRVYPFIKQIEERCEREAESLEVLAGEAISRAYVAICGKSYPDADSTLRLSYGTISKTDTDDEFSTEPHDALAATADIVPGNSGGPVVDKAGKLAGLISRIYNDGLVGRFAYNARGRAHGIFADKILEALKNTYNMPMLVKEITGEILRPDNKSSV